ncbi:MAG: hypothetical protein L7U62_06345 [Candidatus Poseidoniaceae archaeon]|nr:hypothetical protein [Candidatus Poseidoniaceae archaeon]
MVDLNTAMAAAAGERQKRMADEGKERKKRRSGSDLGIEAFDPVKHVTKEKAETVSMWLVIAFSVVVSLLMRYVLMPRTSVEKSDILYLAPLAAVFLIPQVHRLVLPASLNEVYTKGTWFKAGFLHTFTFLAMAFLLVNPPLGDIVAPQLADKWVLVQDDGEQLNFSQTKGASSSLTWEVDSSAGLAGDIWLLFGLADNLNVEGANVTVELTNNAGNNLLVQNNLDFWDNNSESIANNTSSSSSESKLIPHGDLDQRFALLLGTDLAVGEHQITVRILEQGDPWVNTRVYNWDLLIVEALPEADAS